MSLIESQIQPGNQWRLSHKKALITGGTKGIGFSIAEVLLSLGAEVMIVARDREEMDHVCQTWRNTGFKASGVDGDLSNRHDQG